MKNKNSFVFYRSFSEAMDELSDNDQLTLYRAIVDYGLDADTTTLNSPYLRMAWKLIQPQLDANWRRYENGCKGGAPLGSRNNPNGRRGNKPRTNQGLTKNKTNDNVNVNGNDNGNDNDNEKKDTNVSSVSVPADTPYSKYLEWRKKECPHLSKMQEMSEKEFITIINFYDKEAVFKTLTAMENYKDTAKKNRSIYRTLRNWLNRNYGKEREKGGER